MVLLLSLAGGMQPVFAQSKLGIINTKHNLSVTGPGEIRALTEERICVFCHTPHNASPKTPLWNKNMDAVNYDAYTPYTSTTLRSTPARPTGPSRLCLSCHDGTLALGDVLSSPDQIAMTVPTGIPVTSPSYFGGSTLANHHPVSFSYYEATVNPEINPVPPDTQLQIPNGIVQCTTCHDPHDNTYKKFLAVSNEGSALCTLCHLITGWPSASHSTSPAVWNGRSPNPWPRTDIVGPWDFGWVTVQQNGCENCHTPHSAGGAQRLLNSAAEEQNCFPCHNGNVAAKNIQGQFGHVSRHKVDVYIGVHDPTETVPVLQKHDECVDCHNPHASNTSSAQAPYVSGKTTQVKGMNKYCSPIPDPGFATYEYEICFKCHSQTSTLTPAVNRVISTTNACVQFNATNPSYHPVTDIGRVSAQDVPSIPTPFVQDPEVPADLKASSFIYCTDCHSDEVDTGNVLMSRGPHGSPYPPILRRQYLTSDIGVPYNDSNFALCYRCHDKNSIMTDASFKPNSAGYGGHSGHLTGTGLPQVAVNAPCSVCHDPHGIQDNGFTGSHTHLINFDRGSVTAAPGNIVPLYTDKGNHSGSCTLICHGVTHDGSAKFTYGSGVRLHW